MHLYRQSSQVRVPVLYTHLRLMRLDSLRMTACTFTKTPLTFYNVATCHCAGFEARGLIFGAPLALALGCAFVPLRKPGKLPGETIQEAYDLEYGTDKIEVHLGHITEGQRVLLLDDLIATGGTMGAGIKLMGAPSRLAQTSNICISFASHMQICLQRRSEQKLLSVRASSSCRT
jgi:adenine phosphoribosyltransferase